MIELSSLTPDLVNRTYPEFNFFVTSEWVEDYKRSVGYSIDRVGDPDFVPETFLACFRDSNFWIFEDLNVSLSQLLHVNQRYEFFARAKVGDHIQSRARITKIMSKIGKAGGLVFMDIENPISRLNRETGAYEVIANTYMSVVVRSAAPAASKPASGADSLAKTGPASGEPPTGSSAKARETTAKSSPKNFLKTSQAGSLEMPQIRSTESPA